MSFQDSSKSKFRLHNLNSIERFIIIWKLNQRKKHLRDRLILVPLLLLQSSINRDMATLILRLYVNFLPNTRKTLRRQMLMPFFAEWILMQMAKLPSENFLMVLLLSTLGCQPQSQVYRNWLNKHYLWIKGLTLMLKENNKLKENIRQWRTILSQRKRVCLHYETIAPYSKNRIPQLNRNFMIWS
jgi:hypothetical protein